MLEMWSHHRAAPCLSYTLSLSGKNSVTRPHYDPLSYWKQTYRLRRYWQSTLQKKSLGGSISPNCSLLVHLRFLKKKHCIYHLNSPKRGITTLIYHLHTVHPCKPPSLQPLVSPVIRTHLLVPFLKRGNHPPIQRPEPWVTQPECYPGALEIFQLPWWS